MDGVLTQGTRIFGIFSQGLEVKFVATHEGVDWNTQDTCLL